MLHGFEVLDADQVEAQPKKRVGRRAEHEEFFLAMESLPIGKVLKVPVPADLDGRQYATRLIAARSHRGVKPPQKNYVWTYQTSSNGRTLYYRWIKDTGVRRKA